MNIFVKMKARQLEKISSEYRFVRKIYSEIGKYVKNRIKISRVRELNKTETLIKGIYLYHSFKHSDMCNN
jgi:hypothetical protein